MVKVEIIINEDMADKQSIVRCFIQEGSKATQKEYLTARAIASYNYDFIKDKSVDDLLKITETEKKDEQANNKN